ncbi:hypothetical protein [Nonlabens agnitus]|uniref:Uncharacterized protein n=1 Tax=Nonlabens agnitus TaxID=870484 RepID=A0A2S9WU58_9FLAO|nr:hypothetical protein [Nonlabens agnitus]PRP67010.1 hypothetical protein BST86_07805 [Nonlabens agnitus]
MAKASIVADKYATAKHQQTCHTALDAVSAMEKATEKRFANVYEAQVNLWILYKADRDFSGHTFLDFLLIINAIEAVLNRHWQVCRQK